MARDARLQRPVNGLHISSKVGMSLSEGGQNADARVSNANGYLAAAFERADLQYAPKLALSVVEDVVGDLVDRPLKSGKIVALKRCYAAQQNVHRLVHELLLLLRISKASRCDVPYVGRFTWFVPVGLQQMSPVRVDEQSLQL